MVNIIFIGKNEVRKTLLSQLPSRLVLQNTAGVARFQSHVPTGTLIERAERNRFRISLGD